MGLATLSGIVTDRTTDLDLLAIVQRTEVEVRNTMTAVPATIVVVVMDLMQPLVEPVLSLATSLPDTIDSNGHGVLSDMIHRGIDDKLVALA